MFLALIFYSIMLAHLLYALTTFLLDFPPLTWFHLAGTTSSLPYYFSPSL